MSVDYTKIQQAFIAKWQTLNPLPKTQYENNNPETVENGMFVALRFLPSIPDYPELGNDAQSFERGFFTTTIYTVEGSGWKTVSDLANKIVTLFKRNTVLTYSGATVKIKKSYMSSPSSEDGAYQVPVLIEYEGWFN